MTANSDSWKQVELNYDHHRVFLDIGSDETLRGMLGKINQFRSKPFRRVMDANGHQLSLQSKIGELSDTQLYLEHRSGAKK
jgi:hypothetical protein